MEEWIEGQRSQMVGGSCEGEEVGNIKVGEDLEDEFVGEGDESGVVGCRHLWKFGRFGYNSVGCDYVVIVFV